MTATPSVCRPVGFSPWVGYRKEEVWEVCAALALAESLLTRLDHPIEAARMAEVFEVVEDRLSG